MIRWWAVRTLIAKELLDIVRDRRSLFLIVILPLLMYPLLFLVVSQVAISQVQKIQAADVRVAVLGAEVPPGLAERVTDDHHIELRATPTPEDPKTLLQDDEKKGEGFKAVLLLPPDLAERLRDDATIDVTILYDETSETSRRARGQLRDLLKEWSADLVTQRLERRELAPELARPLNLEAVNVAPPKKVGGHFLGMIVPMLIVMLVVLGAFYPAIELTAGEKERGTMQTLLTAPIGSLEIVGAKFLAVFFVALLTGAANVLSIGLLVGMSLVLPAEAAAAVDFGMTLSTVLLTGYVTLLIGLFFSALMMTVAVLARNFKEAQAYMTPVYMVGVLPVMFAQLPGMELSGALMLVPGLNHALLLREILEGEVVLDHLFAVTGSSLLFTILCLVVAARIFEREAILLGEVGLTGLFSPGERPRTAVPALGEALGLTVVLFVVMFYGGSILQAWWLLGGVAATQWLLLLVPVLIFLRVRRHDVRASLGLRAASPRTLLAAGCLGGALWVPLQAAMLQLQEWTASDVPDPMREQMEEMFAQLLGVDTPVWALLLVIAFSPAVCEEVVFRGVLLRSMVGKYKTSTIVLTTSILFGLFHMSAIRFLPTAGLGVIMALLALRSGSLLPSMLFHLVHNGISALLAHYQYALTGITIPGTPSLLPLAASLAVIGLGAWLLAGATAPGGDRIQDATHS